VGIRRPEGRLLVLTEAHPSELPFGPPSRTRFKQFTALYRFPDGLLEAPRLRSAPERSRDPRSCGEAPRVTFFEVEQEGSPDSGLSRPSARAGFPCLDRRDVLVPYLRQSRCLRSKTNLVVSPCSTM
jgi:hypothetical protein